jgi:hypothetical protein
VWIRLRVLYLDRKHYWKYSIKSQGKKHISIWWWEGIKDYVELWLVTFWIMLVGLFSRLSGIRLTCFACSPAVFMNCIRFNLKLNSEKGFLGVGWRCCNAMLLDTAKGNHPHYVSPLEYFVGMWNLPHLSFFLPAISKQAWQKACSI